MARPRRRHEYEPRFDGGAQYVEDEAGDVSGKGRGPALVVVTVLAVLMLAMPVLWGVGQLEAIGRYLSDAALVALWVVWGIILVFFVWILWSLWKRAA